MAGEAGKWNSIECLSGSGPAVDFINNYLNSASKTQNISNAVAVAPEASPNMNIGQGQSSGIV